METPNWSLLFFKAIFLFLKNRIKDVTILAIEKKYASLSTLTFLVDNIKTKYAKTLHTHTKSDIEDISDIVNEAVEISSQYTNEKVGQKYEPIDDDIPKVFIDGVIPTTKDEVQAEMTYISKTLKFHTYITIKCQGTSSMSYPKKNFTVKLFKDEARTEKFKIDFKGWGKQNKFCLKANWIDISHMRNVVSAQLWGDVVNSRADYEELPELLRTSPNNGVVDGFSIKVYNNGVYQGRYTWNIPKDGWMTNMDDELETHCILCGENYDSGCFRTLPIIDESDWSDELHDTTPESIKTSWSNAINFVMTSSDEEFRTNIGNYFDLQSLLDYHVFGIYICGLDSYGKNQIYLTYDGVKWIASMYDLDSTWGLYWNGQSILSYDYGREQFEDQIQGRMGNLLYERLEQNFYSELQIRWEELKSSALAMSNIINRFERMSDLMPPELVKEDYASTTANGQYVAIPSVAKNNIQQIRNFAAARRSWTDKYFTSLQPVERIPCTGITLGTFTLFFDETSESVQQISVSVSPSNTTDKIVWTSADESIATVSKNGYVSAVSIGNTTITATCGDYSRTVYVYVTYIKEDISEGEIVYQLPAAITFDGSNYIDTGVTPLATDDPFTVFVDWTDTNESEFVASKYVVMHCMNENSPYNGMILQYAPAGIVSEYRQNSVSISSNSTGGLIENADLERVKVIYRKSADGTITVARCYNENGQIYKNEKAMEYVAVSEALRLGCYRSNTGGTGRFAKGILNDCKVYNYALSDEEMNELLLSTTEQPPQATETYLRRNFRPQGGKWTDEVTDFNFGRGDYIEIKVDLSACSGTNENIISIGDSIPNWNQYVGGYHSYYTVSSNSLEVNSLIAAGQEGRESSYPVDKSNVTLLVNADGFHVDGQLLVQNSRIGELNKIQIGSAEGNTRSNAIYEYIKVTTMG